MSGTTNPLQVLPAEIILRVLEFCPTAAVASLTCVSKAWNEFIDKTHQDAIYASPDRTPRPTGAKDFSFLSELKSFTSTYQDVRSWKDLCKRQTLLAKNWNSEQPATHETTVRIGDDPIWRFRPDFQRRLLLATSHAGGLTVTDLDTGQSLWSLGLDEVRPFAHLEYQDGTAVWDREGDALEVWRTGLEGLARGEFRQVAVLPHDIQTRGFQLSFDTLCVVSSEGKGFVYDMPGNPRLRTEVEIASHAIGHLDQDADVVVFSLGAYGYHFYDKPSGKMLGALHPRAVERTYHVVHPYSSPVSGIDKCVSNMNWTDTLVTRHGRSDHRTTPIRIEQGPHPCRDEGIIPLDGDEWGAGMLAGPLFVGVSRGGRLMICNNWLRAIQPTKTDGSDTLDTISMIECDADGSTFDLGGWLSVRDHRVMCEVQDRVSHNQRDVSRERGTALYLSLPSTQNLTRYLARSIRTKWLSQSEQICADCLIQQVYVIGLTDDNTIELADQKPARPSFSFATSLASQFAAPVSFMGIYDDCIMSTYTVRATVYREAFHDADIALDVAIPKEERATRTYYSAVASAANQGRQNPGLLAGLEWRKHY